MLRFALCFAVVAGSAMAADWPVFRGNDRMTGVATANLPDRLPDRERWTFKCRDSVEGSPAIANGVVYVASTDKYLYALDLATGKEKWKLALAPMKASPAVRSGRVYVGDVEGKFHAVDAATGNRLWSFETQGEITAGANFYKDTILIGAHDSTLYCLTADGKKKWAYQIDGPVNGSAAVIADRTFVAGCDSVLHVLNAEDGKPIGTVDLGGQAAATAALTDEFAFVGTMTNQVVAVDWKRLKKVWEFEPKRRQQPFYASAAVTDRYVVASSRDRKIYALDRATGQEKWSFVTEGMVDASPVVVGNRVYVGCLSNTGEFYVLDLDTGKQIQQLTFDGAVTGSVAVGPDCLVVGTEKGTVYCLGK
jgi:outer membrane protein assembly factor BamB